MKEVKDYQMKCRLTQTEKERVLEYCEKHNMSISDFVRYACERIFYYEEKNFGQN